MKTYAHLLLKCSAALMVAGALQLQANTLLVDRGLPTANLNNAAGANRSNVAWAYGSDNNGSWLVGDTFTNNSLNTYYIDTIRLWTVGTTTSASLWGGLTGATAFNQISNSYTSATATYANSSTYQGSSGSPIVMTQLDFAVNIALGAGDSFLFFLDGSRPSSPFIPFIHASNASLGGAPSDGADDIYYFGLLNSGVIDAGNVGATTSQGNGWDKASDVNVQVYGNVPDSGSTVALLGCALAGFAFFRRRRS